MGFWVCGWKGIQEKTFHNLLVLHRIDHSFAYDPLSVRGLHDEMVRLIRTGKDADVTSSKFLNFFDSSLQTVTSYQGAVTRLTILIFITQFQISNLACRQAGTKFQIIFISFGIWYLAFGIRLICSKEHQVSQRVSIQISSLKTVFEKFCEPGFGRRS